MLTPKGLVYLIAAIVCLVMVNAQIHDKKRVAAVLSERFGVHPHHNDGVNRDFLFHQKRQLKKKWAKLVHDSQSPYTIAFPALIRTRRWTDDQDRLH